MNTELTTAITDLLLFILCILAAWAVNRVPNENVYHTKLWRGLFLAFAAAALLGYLYHRFHTGKTVQELWWLLLYPTIFEATRYNLLLALYARFGKERPGAVGKRWLVVSEGVLCTAAVVLRFFFRRVSLCMYLIFAVGMVLLSLYHYGVLLKDQKVEAVCFFGGLFLVIPAIAVQCWQKETIRLIWEFDHNGVCHLLLLAALLLFFGGAVLSLRQEGAVLTE